LIRLFVCGQTEPEQAVAAALAPLPLADAVEAGLVERSGGGLRAALEIEAYGGQWIVSDVDAAMRPGRPLPPEHVLGVGGASTTLAQATIRRPVGTALDLGTGCGIQALHLSSHAARVTATDLSQRALRFAATTAALSGLDWELLQGDLTQPVADRRFDLVVSNPPFVVGPGTTTHTYRDSGRAGDAVCAELAAAAPRLLNEGGYMQFLANWLHVAGEDWADRVAGWVAGTGLDAWVVQREVSDPVGYVNLWLADAAEDPATQPARAAAWLDWFDANKIEAVGLGLVTAPVVTTTRRSGWRTSGSRWTARWASTSRPGSTGRTGCAASPARRCSARTSSPSTGCNCARRRPAGRRGGRSTANCSPSPEGCAGSSRSTRSYSPWSAPATGHCRCATTWMSSPPRPRRTPRR
jgi:methylase of polypeptide subunit release factors